LTNNCFQFNWILCGNYKFWLRFLS